MRPMGRMVAVRVCVKLLARCVPYGFVCIGLFLFFNVVCSQKKEKKLIWLSMCIVSVVCVLVSRPFSYVYDRLKRDFMCA